MTDLVKVDNLAVDFATAYGNVPALKGISFSVARGEALGIVGESGSGKTVACRAILRLIAANALVQSGRILVDEKDVLTMSDAELQRFRGEQAAMIFQNPSTHLDPIMPIGRQVGEAMVMHRGLSWRETREKVVSLLKDMQITDPERRFNAYPHELSGGMRQRVMIAAALACEPNLLIADEPTTALDVTVQAQILDLLRRIRRERQLTLVLVSHDLGVIAEMCDRIVVMKDGRVIETGSIDQILSAPQDDYTRRLIASQPSLLKPRPRTATRRAGLHVAAEQACGVDQMPTTVEKPQLEATNLKVEFRAAQSLAGWVMRRPAHRVIAADNISFSLKRGGSLGIVGESGSGKSTIARTIIGLVEPQGGEIRLDGETMPRGLAHRSAQQQRKLQMVFQDPFLSLNPAFTVAQTLAEPLRKHRLCTAQELPARLASLMAKAELPEALLHRRTNQLSGGQRQRVGIARALALNPEILIADEVTSALDVTIQAQILGLFERLREEMSLSLILISHDLAVVRYLCDHVAVMKQGRMVEYGPTEAVLDQPQEAYTRALIAAIPNAAFRDGKVSRLSTAG